jgi:hypothetical protein
LIFYPRHLSLYLIPKSISDNDLGIHRIHSTIARNRSRIAQDGLSTLSRDKGRRRSQGTRRTQGG